MKKKGKRRQYPIVHRSRQYSVLAYVMVYSFAISGFLLLTLFIPDILAMQSPGLSLAERSRAAERVLTLHTRIWPTLLALICIIGLHSFRTFHRFVGPIYKLTTVFEAIKNGEIRKRVTLRKGDFLRKEEVAFNAMMEIVSAKIERVHIAGNRAQTVMEKIEKERLVSEDENWTELKRHIHEILDAAGYFKAGNDDVSDSSIR